MAQITLNVTDLQAEAIAAQADLEGVTVDELFAPWVRDITHNRAGIRADAPESIQADLLAFLKARAAEAVESRKTVLAPIPEAPIDEEVEA